jgi:hypothetical protein
MTWFSPYGENYAHTGAFTGSMNRKGLSARCGVGDRHRAGQDRQVDRAEAYPQWVEREVFYLIADEQTNTKLQINQAQYDHMLANAKKLEARCPASR